MSKEAPKEEVWRDRPKISVSISHEALEFLDGEWGEVGHMKKMNRSRRLDFMIKYVKKQVRAAKAAEAG